ncbi:MFS transporter [Candidatus Uhrbacteria bacterium]|nr:MFS transporter [Candidatus Uhrbacteria bacterium]
MHTQSPILQFLHNRELDELYVMTAIRGFATSMIGIFIPIYLITLGYSLSAVLIFYIVRQAVYWVASFPAAYLDARFDFKHTMLISMPFLVIFFSLLATLQTMSWPLWVLAVASGIELGIFWTSYHTDFALMSDGKSLGKEVGFVQFCTKISNVAGPLAGGILISMFGFTMVLVIVNLLLVISILPLFISKDIHSKVKISFKNTFFGKGWKDYIALAASGFEAGVAGVIWPIFIFFYVVSDFTTVGLVTTVSLAFSIIAVVMAAELADKHRDLIMRLGAWMHAIVWGLKAFVVSAGHVFVSDSFHGTSRTLMMVPFNAKMYNKAGRVDALQYVLFRASAISFGAIILYVAMLFVVDLTTSFWLAGAASLLLLLF